MRPTGRGKELVAMRILHVIFGLAVLAAGRLAACAPAPAPQPAPAAPVQAAAPAPAPAREAWQDEWDQVVAAARQEGTVAVAGPPGPRYRDAVTTFEQAYPGIALQFTGGFGRDHL